MCRFAQKLQFLIWVYLTQFEWPIPLSHSLPKIVFLSLTPPPQVGGASRQCFKPDMVSAYMSLTMY